MERSRAERPDPRRKLDDELEGKVDMILDEQPPTKEEAVRDVLRAKKSDRSAECWFAAEGFAQSYGRISDERYVEAQDEEYILIVYRMMMFASQVAEKYCGKDSQALKIDWYAYIGAIGEQYDCMDNPNRMLNLAKNEIGQYIKHSSNVRSLIKNVAPVLAFEREDAPDIKHILENLYDSSEEDITGTALENLHALDTDRRVDKLALAVLAGGFAFMLIDRANNEQA
ncbi:hypothetical protein CR983_01555 [Candidatus Saccharibacteria bacterium]|nr:MAG: hypothetical protein CR983_01555 [Candidatus Saccharibacteria bacterium]